MPDISDLRGYANELRAFKSTSYDDWRNFNLEVANVLCRHASIYDAFRNENTNKSNTIKELQDRITLLSSNIIDLTNENQQLQIALTETQQQLNTALLMVRIT